MFRWFAPLLLLAGKPDVLLRVVIAAVAAAVLMLGVWLASNIAVTFDSLKSPTIALIYGAVLVCFFIGVGAVAWLRLRRLAAPRALIPAKPLPELPLPDPLVAKRAAQMTRQWERRSRLPSKFEAEPPPVAPVLPTELNDDTPARGALTVTGPAFSGKTALIAGLVHASGGAVDQAETVRLVDAGPIDGDAADLAAVAESAAASDGVLFVVDQDLRAPEAAAIARLMATGKPLYVVLNKADQFNAADRDAILVSIRAKMPKGFAPANVVSVAVEPSAVEREIEDARGAVRVELRRPSADIRALSALLERIFPPAAGRALRFQLAA